MFKKSFSSNCKKYVTVSSAIRDGFGELDCASYHINFLKFAVDCFR